MKKRSLVFTFLLVLSLTANMVFLAHNYKDKPKPPVFNKTARKMALATKVPATQDKNQLGAIWWSGAASKNQIAITFDDGPDPRYTKKILDILDHYHVKATFFEVGSIAERFPEITKDIVSRGNALGNHTYSHPTINIPAVEKEKQIIKTNEALEKITGQKVNLFRSPYGYFDTTYFTISKKLGMNQITWSVVPEDYNKPGSSVIVNRVLQQAENGSVILLHDGGGDRTQTVQALGPIIEGLQQKGYRLVTVPELLELK